MSRMLTFSSTSALLGVISIRGEAATTTVALGGTDLGAAICASGVGAGDAIGAPRASCPYHKRHPRTQNREEDWFVFHPSPESRDSVVVEDPPVWRP